MRKCIDAIEDVQDLATRHDMKELELRLETKISDLKAELIKWNVGTIVAMTGIFGILPKLFG